MGTLQERSGIPEQGLMQNCSPSAIPRGGGVGCVWGNCSFWMHLTQSILRRRFQPLQPHGCKKNKTEQGVGERGAGVFLGLVSHSRSL